MAKYQFPFHVKTEDGQFGQILFIAHGLQTEFKFRSDEGEYRWLTEDQFNEIVDCPHCHLPLEHVVVNGTHIYKCEDCPNVMFEYSLDKEYHDLGAHLGCTPLTSADLSCGQIGVQVATDPDHPGIYLTFGGEALVLLEIADGKPAIHVWNHRDPLNDPVYTQVIDPDYWKVIHDAEKKEE